MKTIIILIFVSLLAGCQTHRITDPKTGIIFDQRSFLTKQGPKEITMKDGDREISVKTGAKDQTAVANKLIELGASLK